MIRTVLKGLNGSNPLGFMASVGLLRLLEGQDGSVRLGFTEDGTFQAWMESNSTLDIANISALVARDAASSAGPQPWRLEYEKTEKKGTEVVADLKAPSEQFSKFLVSAIHEWIAGKSEQADYAAAYGTDVACDLKGNNTKPTAFHFTAANQQFLGTVEETRSRVTKEWVEEALHNRPEKIKQGKNLRWDPDAERSRALMGANPNDDGTCVNVPLEWLAFRALPAFRCVPVGDRIMTCGVTGRRQDDFRFHWPLWSCRASYATVRSLLTISSAWREGHDTERKAEERRRRGIFSICTSEIRRMKGFGNFGPALVRV